MSHPTTPVPGSTVAIVGGSIAGCALAIALDRLGCEVTILERSSAGLKDRGSGIAIPKPLRDELIDNDYLPPEYPTWSGGARRWYLADGSDAGAHLWTQAGNALTNNWGSLWRGLRSNVPASVRYQDSSPVTAIEDTGAEVAITTTDGTNHTFDIAFGADGYRSLVRSTLHPESAPTYAGYVLWRGNFPADQLSDRTAWDEVCATGEWLSVAFDGGHAVMYPIPDFDAEISGRLRVNWAIYAPTPDELTLSGPSSIPPGAVDDACDATFRRLLDTTMPARLRPLFDSPQKELSIQPIYDERIDHYTSGRLALIGDAATLSRPHTGSGATKAMQDARLIETLGAEHTDWGALLAAYDEDRSAVGQSLVELGRRIGRDQVERTPPWAQMTPADFEAWAAGSLAGETLYFWSADEDDTEAPAEAS